MSTDLRKYAPIVITEGEGDSKKHLPSMGTTEEGTYYAKSEVDMLVSSMNHKLTQVEQEVIQKKNDINELENALVWMLERFVPDNAQDNRRWHKFDSLVPNNKKSS